MADAKAPHPDKIPTARIVDAQRIATEYKGLTVEERKRLVIGIQCAAEDLAAAEVAHARATEALAGAKKRFRDDLDALNEACRDADMTVHALYQRLVEMPK